ncbi:MAG: GNAT family N-acetyltransferase, partial [Treponema sp.]|nr:GNAT family N-acetyltransferase [Treponema sp.]
IRYWDLLRKEEKYDDSFIMLSRRNKCQGFIHFTREEGFVFVNYLYIKKSQRKRGYGKKLLNLTKADRIQLFCQPENKNAQEFYRHLSFKKLPESGNPDLDRLELVIHKNKLSYTS